MPTTTKRWAVSRIDWFKNDLTTKIVTAETDKAAFAAAYPDFIDFFDGTDSLATAKETAFNCDGMIHVEEIPPLEDDDTEKKLESAWKTSELAECVSLLEQLIGNVNEDENDRWTAVPIPHNLLNEARAKIESLRKFLAMSNAIRNNQR